MHTDCIYQHGGAAHPRCSVYKKCCISGQYAYTPRNGIHQPFSYVFYAQTLWWFLNIYGVPKQSMCFLLGVCFENVFSPKGWQTNFPNLSNPKMFGSYPWHNGVTQVHMQIRCKSTPIHVNMSPTCFERSRGRKIRVRGPGPENRVYMLLFFRNG